MSRSSRHSRTEHPTSDYGSVSSLVGISIAGVHASTGRGPSVPGAGPAAASAIARTRGPEADMVAAVRAQTPVQRRYGIGLVVPESANDRG
jgi:hypothetical protein